VLENGEYVIKIEIYYNTCIKVQLYLERGAEDNKTVPYGPP